MHDRSEGPGWPAGVVAYDDPRSTSCPATFREHDAEGRLEQHGFAVVPFLGPSQAAQLRSLYDELGPAPGDPRTGFFQGNVSTSIEWKRAVRSAIEPLVTGAMDRTFSDQRAFLITYLVKWPGEGGRLPPHVDPTMVADEHRERGVTLWCPLDPPADVDDGWLRVVPGSHLLPFSHRYRAKGGHAPSAITGLESHIDEELAVPLRPAWGEAVVFDHRLIHHSRGNVTQQPRVVLGIAMHARGARSLHVESWPDGRVDFFEIDDEYYIRNDRVGSLPYDVVRTAVAEPAPSLSLDDLRTGLDRWVADGAPGTPSHQSTVRVSKGRRTHRRVGLGRRGFVVEGAAPDRGAADRSAQDRSGHWAPALPLRAWPALRGWRAPAAQWAAVPIADAAVVVVQNEGPQRFAVRLHRAAGRAGLRDRLRRVRVDIPPGGRLLLQPELVMELIGTPDRAEVSRASIRAELLDPPRRPERPGDTVGAGWSASISRRS